MTEPSLHAAATALLDAAERHIFGDECLAERDALRAALARGDDQHGEGYEAAIVILRAWAPGFYSSMTRQLLESAAEDLARVKPQALANLASLASLVNPIIHRCTSTKSEDGGSASPRVPCDGEIRADGTMTGGCGEPCDFIMDNPVSNGDPNDQHRPTTDA